MNKMKLKTLLLIVSFLLNTSCGLIGDRWETVTVDAGNFSVECPANNVVAPDDETGYLICKGSDADYMVFSQEIDRHVRGGDGTMMVEKQIDGTSTEHPDYEKVFSSAMVERYGHKVQETVAKEKWLGDPPSTYDIIRDGKPRLLIVENAFATGGRKYIITLRYEIDNPDAFQQVLDRHKEKRQRFLDSFKLIGKN